MFKSHLKTLPATKFVLIEDTLQESGKELFNYVLRNHIEKSQKIHYFVFEGVFHRVKTQLVGATNITLHDFVSPTSSENFSKALEKVSNAVAVVDSLSQALHRFGVSEVYKLLNNLCKKKNILQLIAILHLDLLDDAQSITKIYEHLATCCVRIQPKVQLENRLSYIYKKIGGKIIRQDEVFKFVDGELVTEPIKKLDAASLVKESLDVNPETLTTFKISLDDKEKESRDKLVLPYLPKEKGDGKIIYEFDSVDDWDEEDPDDDLDI